MVTSFKQYRYDYLYFYSNGRSVCDYQHLNHHGKSQNYPKLRISSPYLFRRYLIRLTHNLYQWNNRKLVSSIRQYRYDILYFHANSRLMCYYSSSNHNSEPKGSSNFCSSRSHLFWHNLISLTHDIK